jgi:uncharacterized protein involved in exopolysaccharide biosynthesis
MMQTGDADAITLRQLLELLWREKWLIVGLIVGMALAAALLSKTQPRIYKAHVMVSPASNNPSAMGRLGGGGSQVGGLASLIGLSIGGDSSKEEALAVLQSEALTQHYVREQNLLPLLFPDQWDPVAGKWRPSKPEAVPSLWKANKMFEKIRTVSEDKKTGLTTMTIAWTDAATAAKWANDLVGAANDYLRNKAIRESEQHIAYLNEQAAKTDVAQVRSAIYTVLESEIKNEMLAKGPGDYALKVIDPAFPPERRSSPLPFLWAGVGAFAGLMLSFAVLFLRMAWKAGA